MSNYIRLVILVQALTLALLTVYFTLVAAPDLSALTRHNPYLACSRLMNLLDTAQSILLLVFLAIAALHLAYGVQKVFSGAPLPLDKLFIPVNFSLTREILFDFYLLIVVLVMLGIIEGVQLLFDCGSLVPN